MEPPHEEANTNRKMGQRIILIVTSIIRAKARKNPLYYYTLCMEESPHIKEEIFFKKEWAPLLFPEQPFLYFKRPTEKASKN